MVDLPDWLDEFSPVAIVVGVVIVAAVVAAVATAGLPSGRAALPSALALFVLAMIVLDLRRRD